MDEITISRNPEVRKIIEGRASSELLALLMKKQLGIGDEEYLECFTFALTYDDLRQDARMRLQEIPEAAKKSYLQKRDASERVIKFIVDEALVEKNVALLCAAVQSKWMADEFLIKIALTAPEAVLDVMTQNPLPLVATPEIMGKMLQNPQISGAVRQKIDEIKALFFESEKSPDHPTGDASAAHPAGDASAASPTIATANMTPAAVVPATVAPIAGSYTGNPAGSGKGELQIVEETQTIYQKISHMSTADKIRLAFKGGKSERMILMKDPNKVVQTAVIDSPKLTEEEVINMVNDRSIPGDIIAKIADNRDWIRIYPIMFALAQNPKVAVGKATAMLKQLHERDLKALVLDRNINPVVRQLAISFYKTRHQHD